jgi:hypothetical protein
MDELKGIEFNKIAELTRIKDKNIAKAMKKFRKAETSLVMQLKDNALDLETLNKIHHEIWIQLQKECNDSWERYDKARAIHFNNLFELIR